MESISQEAEVLKDQWKAFYDTAEKPVRCLFCSQSRIWWNGWRHRSASVLVGDQIVHLDEVACRLVKCAHPGCGKSWTLRPPGLAPQRHYQLDVVAQALGSYLFDPETTQDHVARSIGCVRRSIGRWMAWLAGIADPADLLRHLLDASDTPQVPSLREVAALARKAPTTAKRSILRRGAEVLGLLEALASALTFPPPGLQTVVEAVICDRYRATTFKAPQILDFARRHLHLAGGTLAM